MKQKILQIVLVVFGLFYIALLYPLYMDLQHSQWLVQMNNNECEPMFLSFFIPLGVFLLLAARRPSAHRSLIAFAGWWNIAHAAVMVVESIEARMHGVHREGDPNDIVIAALMGIVLLVLVPKSQATAMAAV